MTFALLLAIVACLFLAFFNGANDNFKGVATLLGSKTASYKVALSWATLTTFAGSIAAFFLAQKLMMNFSGAGLVPGEVVGMSAFTISVAIASGLTVFLATRLGFPVSTTHAITGALVGAGFLASPIGINWQRLGSSFFLPLFLSPLLAITIVVFLYPLLRLVRTQLRIKRESCICIGNEVLMVAPRGFSSGAAAASLQIDVLPQISIGTTVTCEERYMGNVFGLSAKTALDTGHFLSSGLVSFARGLNDTPKIAAILLVGNILSPMTGVGVVAVLIALGGLAFAKRVADTMSYQITEMNDGQAFSANIVTSLVVIGASKFGLPVSTTHVSCGTLFGIGVLTKRAKWGPIGKIILAWIVTLPLSGLLGLIAFALLKGAL